MGSKRIAQSGSLVALIALALQGCAPVSPSFPKQANNGNSPAGGGSNILTSEEGGQIVLGDSRAVAVVVIGSKEADETIRNLPEAIGKPMELPVSDTDEFKRSGTYDHALRGVGSKMSATAIIVLDENAIAASGITAEQLKSVRFVWSIAMDRKTIGLGVSSKTPATIKAAILPTIKTISVSVVAIR